MVNIAAEHQTHTLVSMGRTPTATATTAEVTPRWQVTSHSGGRVSVTYRGIELVACWADDPDSGPLVAIATPLNAHGVATGVATGRVAPRMLVPLAAHVEAIDEALACRAVSHASA